MDCGAGAGFAMAVVLEEQIASDEPEPMVNFLLNKKYSTNFLKFCTGTRRRVT
jgi:hypothetical protein